MKIKILLLFLIFVCSGIKAQDLVLTGNALVSIQADGIPVSVSGVKLKDNSILKHAEFIKLNRPGFIVLDGKGARLHTNQLATGKKVEITVGIDSKTSVKIVNTGGPSAFSIGMEDLSEPDALPYFWKLSSIHRSGEEKTNIQLTWEVAAEPTGFTLKGLVQKIGNVWRSLANKLLKTSSAEFENHQGLGAEAMFTIKSIHLDSDFDGVPDIQEMTDGTDPYDATDYLDSDGDEVPDYVEILNGTDVLDPVDFRDSDEDGVPDYIELIQGTDPNDNTDFQDSNGDGIADYIRDRSAIALMGLETIHLAWGISDVEANLPERIPVVTGSGNIVFMEIDWKTENVNSLKRGNYSVLGTLLLPKGIYNTYGLIPELIVQILPKPAPTDIVLDNNSFEGDINEFFIPVGSLTVIDPVDDMHSILLHKDGYDNKYFEIKDGMLFWSSSERAEGKINFTIVLQVTDRDGNSLEKLFEINRIRPRLSEIEVVNTFTPNADGMNENWGVPELRFYQGSRIQVFERSGKRLFYTENPDVLWDGTFEGKAMPVGTYYWVIEVRETGETRKGLLNLIRQ